MRGTSRATTTVMSTVETKVTTGLKTIFAMRMICRIDREESLDTDGKKRGTSMAETKLQQENNEHVDKYEIEHDDRTLSNSRINRNLKFGEKSGCECCDKSNNKSGTKML